MNDEHRHAPAEFNHAFVIGIALNTGFVAVEAFFESLALLADAGHNLSDVAGLVLAWGGALAGRLKRSTPRCMLRDRDRIFGQDLRNQVKAMGIEEGLSAPRSPWQRAYVERVIGSIRPECLDYVIVLSEASLGRTLTSYFAYYHEWRTHLSLGKDAPESRRIQPPQEGRVIEIPAVGVCTTITNGGQFDFRPPQQPCPGSRYLRGAFSA